MKEFVSPNPLANKLLDLILEEKDLMNMLLHGDMEASANALESLLMSSTMISSRLTATHLVRFMDLGVDMKEVMVISDEISDVVSEIFDETLKAELTAVAKDMDGEDKASKVKPTSH